MKLLVHGGAGGPPDDPAGRADALERAVTSGLRAETVLDAVVDAVADMEADGRFNAGRGCVPQSDARVRTDAGLMDSSRGVGAICAMPGVTSAIEVARIVMCETPHILIAGDRAVDLAAAHDLDVTPTPVDDATIESAERAGVPHDGTTAEQLAWVRDRFGTDSSGGSNHDTVGAVARSGEDLAAATSTGGRRYALAGRVGDVPQVGSGFYCSAAGAASATGAGEDIARVTLARRAVDHLEAGLDPSTAADRAIEEFERVTDSTAGIIVIDTGGQTGLAYNSEAMQTAVGSRD